MNDLFDYVYLLQLYFQGYSSHEMPPVLQAGLEIE